METNQAIEELRGFWRTPPRLKLSDWADEHARLSAESSADTGRWEAYPFQRGMMDAISDRRIEQVTVMKSARVGWTKIMNHAIAYHIAADPCPIMVVQPTLGDAEGYSKDEIEPMLRDTPILEGRVADPGKRDSGNTILHKRFPGGQLRLVGADSPRGFRRVTIKLLAFDEVDGYAPTAGEEGDQIKLGIRRTETVPDRKILAGSTPTLDATSRIKRMFEKSDMRYYFVPCPHCDHKQVLIWQRFKWVNRDPSTVYYECESCEKPIYHHQKAWMVESAFRRQLAGEPGIGWVATRPEVKNHAGFHIWAAYSYSANATWQQLVADWLDSHKNIEERKTFQNTVLGETYKGEGDAPDWKKLYDRREQYARNVVPAGGLILYAGVDVQKNRIEVEIVAYGRRMESWSVDYRVFPGDTDDLDSADSPWRKLDDLLNESWPHEVNGVAMQILRMGVDTGYATNTVYTWCAKHPRQRVLPMDGRDNFQMALGQPKPVDITVRGKKKKRGLMLWPIGDGMLKTELYGWLKQDKPTDESGAEMPWGWCHFPEYDPEYFKQITAEEIIPRLVKGFRRYHWEKTRERNEALDCRKYARAAAALDGIDRWDDERWQDIEKELGIDSEENSAGDDDEFVLQRPKITRAKDPYLG